MKSIIGMAIGIFLGREVQQALSKRQNQELEQSLRKRLQDFLTDTRPELSPTNKDQIIDKLIKGN